MSDGFSDPVVGGQGTLIRQQIKSPNFSLAGQIGWAILKNGDAYFFNVTATGIITATQFSGNNFIIDSAGIFFYSGPPAFGNLLIAIANTAGTDTFGNSYAQGSNFIMGSKQLVMGETGGNPLIYAGTGNGNITSSGALQAIAVGSGTATYDEWQMLGPKDSTQGDSVVLQMLSSNALGTQQAIAQLFYVDSLGTPHSYISTSYNGGIIEAGSITAAQPGSGTARNNAAIPETWHLATLGTDFTTGGSDQAPRYRLEGLGGGLVRLDGTAVTNVANVASGTTIFVLPVGYRPSVDRRRFVGLTNASGYTAGSTSVMVNTSGAVTTGALAATSGEQFCMDGMVFPID
jgi:hypothetical protein